MSETVPETPDGVRTDDVDAEQARADNAAADALGAADSSEATDGAGSPEADSV